VAGLRWDGWDSQRRIDARDINDQSHNTRVLLRDSGSLPLALALNGSEAIGLAIGFVRRHLVGFAGFSASRGAVEFAGVLGGRLAPEGRGLLGASHGGGGHLDDFGADARR